MSKLVEVDPKQLRKMLPPQRLHLQTRLCAACYEELPVHQAVWQRAKMPHCKRHQLVLLSACPGCGTGFRTPVLWEDDQCEHCHLHFYQMAVYQQPSQQTQRSLRHC